MMPKAIDEVGKGEIEALVSGRERESKTLDYGQELPRATEEGTKEFLADDRSAYLLMNLTRERGQTISQARPRIRCGLTGPSNRLSCESLESSPRT